MYSERKGGEAMLYQLKVICYSARSVLSLAQDIQYVKRDGVTEETSDHQNNLFHQNNLNKVNVIQIILFGLPSLPLQFKAGYLVPLCTYGKCVEFKHTHFLI